MWDLAQRMSAQLCVMPDDVAGRDMTAALAMAAALGLDGRVAAEVLPLIERVAVEDLNEQMGVRLYQRA
ncbi:DUF7697 family protein [Acuticoccus sp.]|uniref:DUF7697 family protein n=1 Tax=Acuticoccus sp. TaxID=1904378 RepID=UPI003B51CDC0